MAGGTGLDSVWTEILGLSSALVEESVDPKNWAVTGRIPKLSKEKLPQYLRSAKAQGLKTLVVADLDPSKLRAIRENPPKLLVITGRCISVKKESLQRLQNEHQILTLGPQACLKLDLSQQEGHALVLCASNKEELEGLEEQVSASHTVAMCPTPPWIPDLFPSLKKINARVCGSVDAKLFSTKWAHWFRSQRDRIVLSTTGFAPLHDPLEALTEDEDEIDRRLALSELERHTGPIFPAAQVLNALLGTTSVKASKSRSPDPSLQGPWNQARRALPFLGNQPGMENPLPELGQCPPSFALLAQSSLLHRASGKKLQSFAPELSELESPSIDEISRARTVLQAAGEQLSDHESKVVLRSFGFEVTRQAVANSASGAVSFADKIGYPVVLKAVSPDLRRKSETGAIKLELANAAAVKRSYSEILGALENNAPRARLDGIAVSEQIESGLDLRVGILRDSKGEAVYYGQAISPIAPMEAEFAFAPLDAKEALWFSHAILQRLPQPALRRSSDPGAHTLAEIYLRLDELWREVGERILALHLSPLRLVDEERKYVVLDARIEQHAHLEGE